MKMCINEFISRLSDVLYENGFYSVDVFKEHIKDKNEILIRVLCKKDNKKYDYNYTLNEKLLDDISIQEIVNNLLMK